MKRAALSAALILFAGQAMACPLSAALFVCSTAGDGALVLCGVDDQIDPGDLLRFNDGSGKVTDIAPERFSFSHWWTDTKTYRMQVSWAEAGRQYRLHSERSETGGGAGLIVTENSAEIARVQCGEAPHVYVGFMQENFACHLDNPYGASSCERLPGGHPPGD